MPKLLQFLYRHRGIKDFLCNSYSYLESSYRCHLALRQYPIALACNVFVRIVALLVWCSSVSPSACLGRACIVIIRCTLPRIWVYGWIVQCSGYFDTRMSTYSQPSFSSSTWKRDGIWMCKLSVISQERLKIEVKLLLTESHASSIGETTDDLEWPWMAVSSAIRAISAVVAERLVLLDTIQLLTPYSSPFTALRKASI